MSYNLTGVEESRNLLQFFQGVNDLSGGWFVTIIIIGALYFILLLSLYKYVQDTKDLFLAVHTIIAFVTLGLWSIGLTGILVVTVVVVFWLGAVLMKLFGGS